MKRVRLVHVTTVAESLGFLSGQPRYLQECGFQVFAVSSPGRLAQLFSATEGVPVASIPMQRRISPSADILSLLRLVRLLRRLRPDIVHAHTPKAGLIAMVAAALTSVSVRIYHMHGLPHQTAIGWRRGMLVLSEWLSCRLAHHVLCVSSSTLAQAEAAGLCLPGRGRVLASGSINGVDATDRFNPLHQRSAGIEVRRRLGIPPDAPVIGYVGRIVIDKGVVELAGSWLELRARYQRAHLLMVGPREDRDAVPQETLDELARDERVHEVGWVDDTAPYYAAMNVLVMPSHREGFGLAAVEAAAMELPVVATRISGVVDAVAEGVTGLLVEPRDVDSLTEAVSRYLASGQLRQSHARAGRSRSMAQFDQAAMWRALEQEYRRLLGTRQ